MPIRAATPDDFDAILGMNQESVHFLSPLDRDRLTALHQMAAYHRVVDAGDGRACAFLLAMREGCAYDSANYQWFATRYARFLYIDRVVIAGDQQGRGLGRQLYADLLSFARADGVETVACEFDTDPPNEPSRRFHASYGFREVGTHRVGATHKQVAMQVLRLEPGAADGITPGVPP
jgi:predicted GNAT superfamily acetyltransferase